jgi:hypothetical protein
VSQKILDHFQVDAASKTLLFTVLQANCLEHLYV